MLNIMFSLFIRVIQSKAELKWFFSIKFSYNLLYIHAHLYICTYNFFRMNFDLILTSWLKVSISLFRNPVEISSDLLWYKVYIVSISCVLQHVTKCFLIEIFINGYNASSFSLIYFFKLKYLIFLIYIWKVFLNFLHNFFCEYIEDIVFFSKLQNIP